MYDNEITLFYSINSNKIKLYCFGKQDMNYFGEDKEDYNYNYIVVTDADIPVGNIQFLVNNLYMYTVEDGKLKFDVGLMNNGGTYA